MSYISQLFVFGKKTASLAEELTEYLGRNAIPFPGEEAVVYAGDILATLSRAILHHNGTGERALVIGRKSDAIADYGLSESDWLDVIRESANAHGVSFDVIEPHQFSESPTIAAAAHLATIVPRWHACEMHDADDLHLNGRPPAGYVARNGRICVDPTAARGIVAALRMIREGWTPATISAIMQKKFAERSKRVPSVTHITPWSTNVIYRIWGNRNTYALGEFVTRSGVVRLPWLAIVPAAWADTPWPAKKPAKQDTIHDQEEP